MAKYRQVHVEFWQDGFVLDLTPEEKYFYIYLMTNSKTTQCGIYELPKRIMETESGYNRETIDKLLARFIDYGKIKYDESSKEIMLVNWMKYNAIKSSKVLLCIKKELENVKNKGFVKEFVTLCKQYGYPIHTLCIDLGEEEEEEVEEEKEEEVEVEEEHQEEIPQPPPQDAITFYQNEIGPLSPFQVQELEYWIHDFNGQEEILILAIRIALDRNKKNMGFIKYLLNTWMSNNLKNLQQVESFEAQQKRKFENPRGRPVRTEQVPEWLEQQKQQSSQVEDSEDIDFEQEKEKLEQDLKKYKGG